MITYYYKQTIRLTRENYLKICGYMELLRHEETVLEKVEKVSYQNKCDDDGFRIAARRHSEY